MIAICKLQCSTQNSWPGCNCTKWMLFSLGILLYLNQVSKCGNFELWKLHLYSHLFSGMWQCGDTSKIWRSFNSNLTWYVPSWWVAASRSGATGGGRVKGKQNPYSSIFWSDEDGKTPGFSTNPSELLFNSLFEGKARPGDNYVKKTIWTF